MNKIARLPRLQETASPLLLVALATLAAISLSGCSPPAVAPEPVTTSDVRGEAAESVAGTGLATSNKILYVDTQECAVADPALAIWHTGNGIASPPLVPEIHAGLMKFTDDDQNPVVTELAERFETSSNHLSYRFVLKPDLRFSDGSPIVAHDFKASWERALRQGSRNGNASDLLGSIVGASDILNGYADQLTGVTVIDDRTLTIALAIPNDHFQMHLAHPVSFVVKVDDLRSLEGYWSDAIDPYGFDAPEVFLAADELPVGAGPFRLTEYQSSSSGKRCVLSRNDYYAGVPASLDHVVLLDKASQILPVGYPGEVMKQLFNDGEVDIDPWVIDSLSSAEVASLENIPGLVRSKVPVAVALLGLNTARPPLDDIEVRSTLLRNSDILTELHGAGWPIPDRITPEILRFGVGDVVPIKDAPLADVPLSASQTRVDGTYWIADDSVSERFGYSVFVANLTERWWRQFGIDLRVTSDPSYDVTRQHPIDGRLWQLTIQYPHPLAVLGVFDEAFGDSVSDDVHGDLNAMFDSAQSVGDSAAAADLYADIEHFILDQALGVTLDWGVGWMPVKVQHYVHGYEGATYPRSLFHQVWLDESAPSRPVPSR